MSMAFWAPMRILLFGNVAFEPSALRAGPTDRGGTDSGFGGRLGVAAMLLRFLESQTGMNGALAASEIEADNLVSSHDA